jgi:PPM family protein phosphatase
MPFTIATAAASSRASSEDRLAVHHVLGGLVIVVADGAGGMSGGAEAAEIVLATVEQAIKTPGLRCFEPLTWGDLLRKADHVVERDPRAGESTAVIVAVSANGLLVGASCGDQEAWVIGSGGYDDLTEDQHSKKRIGSGRANPELFGRASLSGTLLVATDGLFNYARPSAITGVLRGDDLDVAARRLVDLVRLPNDGFADDVALVLVRGEG